MKLFRFCCHAALLILPSAAFLHSQPARSVIIGSYPETPTATKPVSSIGFRLQHHCNDDYNNDFVSGFRSNIQKVFSVLCFSLALQLCPPTVLPSVAASYGSLSDEQKVVAEAWRLVDNSFLDRKFNGQDWFQMRQDLVNKKYKSMDEAYSAIDGMVSKLGDKYTRYLSPAKYQSIVDTATGTLAGVGVEISMNKQGQVIAADVEAASPASEAGIEPDDVFIEVDGTRFDSSATPDDVALKLRGPEGSRVGVVMQREGKTIDYIVTRKPIKITSVKSYVTDVSGVGKVGVIRIKSFSGTTAATVREQYEELARKGAKSFAFDVRGNPGGLLPGGVDTASMFLDTNKPIVYVVNKVGVVDAQTTFTKGFDLESPMVILVDSNTASAAEVFSAALQENKRATVIGEKTFGKGIIQTIRNLSDGNGGVAITVARYETPEHHDINKRGVPVDMESSVECPKKDARACLPAQAFQKPAS